MFAGDKRGSHVGFILSFVIFVTFLLFMYSILQPALKTSEEQQAIMENLKPRILKYVSDNLNVVTVDNSGITGCMSIDIENLPDEVKDNEGIILFTAKDEDGTSKSSSKDNSGIKLEGGTFKIYFSRSLNPTSSSLICITPTTITSEKLRTRTTQEIFLSKIKSLKSEIDDENSYTLLKKDKLGIPSNYNFAINFTDLDDADNPIIIKSNNFENPTEKEVYIKESLINYIDDDANIKYGKIEIKLW